MDQWMHDNLVCPRDHASLEEQDKGTLVCEQGHKHPCVDGIPVLLLEEMEPTQGEFFKSLALVKDPPEERALTEGEVHPHVQRAVGATCGVMYGRLIGKLPRYPIPDLRLPPGSGHVFLDIGCNWGRWCVSAARKGYNVIGLDHSLESLLAARSIARQLGISVRYVVGDARYLPLRDQSVGVVFSYSVLQHFSKPNVRLCCSEFGRVLDPGGYCFVQMANSWGPHNLFVQLKSAFKPAQEFEMRYWTVRELRRTFGGLVGKASIDIDGFFCLDPQTSDLDILPRRFQFVVQVSEILRRLATKAPFLIYFADSLYVLATREGDTQASPRLKSVPF